MKRTVFCDSEEKNTNKKADNVIVLQTTKDESGFIKKTCSVVCGICIVCFALLICAVIYKHNYSVESILSTVLAFFSIFISIFFYFKADETSTKSYHSSYGFMKDVSVTLGKIEERFGEKQEHINEKVSHLDRVSNQTDNEIEKRTEFNNTIIEILEKAKLSNDDRKKYESKISENKQEIESLRESKRIIQQEANRLRDRFNNICLDEENNINMRYYDYRLYYLLNKLLDDGKLPNDISEKDRIQLWKKGYINSQNEIDFNKIRFVLNNVR